MCSPEAMPSCRSLNRSSLTLSLQGMQECPGLAGTTLSRGAPGHAEVLDVIQLGCDSVCMAATKGGVTSLPA